MLFIPLFEFCWLRSSDHLGVSLSFVVPWIAAAVVGLLCGVRACILPERRTSWFSAAAVTLNIISLLLLGILASLAESAAAA
jgi:hypothetical protein